MTTQHPDYDTLLKEYRELQLRVTRFSTTEQELINTRDRLDQELVLYKRLNYFNKVALEEQSDEMFFHLVAETIVDLFEVESSIVIQEDNFAQNKLSFFSEGIKVSEDQRTQAIESAKKLIQNIGLQKAFLADTSQMNDLFFFKPYSRSLGYCFFDEEFNSTVYLFALISKEYEPVYPVLQARHETIFSIFSQQVQSILTNRKKSAKIKSQIEKISASESELRKLSQIATNTVNGVIISDKRGNIEWVNSAFTKITGYLLDEVKGKKPKHFLQGKETDPRAIKKISEALIKKESVELTIINYTKSGSPYYNQLQITPVFDEEGRHSNFIALQKDITEEIRSRQEILNINSRFELIANKSTIGIWERDVITGQSSWNDILQLQYGAEVKKMKEDFAGYWLTCLHPEDRERVQSSLNSFLSSQQDTVEDEFRIIRQTDMQVRTIKTLTIAERDAHGVVVRLVGTNIDVTENKKTEAELQKNLRQQELISEAALELNNVQEFESAVQEVINKIGRHTDVSRVYIFENIENGNACNNTFEWCNQGIDPQKESLQGIPYDVIPYWKQELVTRGIIFSENISELPDSVREILEPQQIKSIIVYPLYVKGDFFGFVGFDECLRYKHWTKSELALLKAFSGIIANAYERHLTEQSLIASERKYRGIIENMNLGLLEADLMGNVVFSNRKFHELTMLKDPALLAPGATPEEILNRPRASQQVLSLRKMDELVYELHFRRPDNREVTFLVSNMVVYNQQQEATGYLGIFLDITPVKVLQIQLENALEERDVFLKKVNSLKVFYEQILNHSPAEIAVINSDMSISYANQMFYESERYAVPNDADHHHLSPQLISHLKDAASLKKSLQREEMLNVDNGEGVYKLRNILPVYKDNQQLEHLIVSGLDISEIKRIENTILKKNDELKKINAELDNFVYSVSHDLRSPLLSVKGILSLIFKTTQQEEKALSYLRMVESTVKRLDETIQEILEYSRNARLEVSEQRVEVDVLLDQIYQDVKYSAANTVSFQVSGADKMIVFSDKNRLNTLLKNIIGNSFKYQKKGNPEGLVKVEVKLDHNNFIVVVEDNGEGIAEKNIGKVFDMFYRASATSVGTGLGLYICKEIVSKLQGNIQIESELGTGTKVTVSVPVSSFQSQKSGA